MKPKIQNPDCKDEALPRLNKSKSYITSIKFVKNTLPPRKIDANKGDNGRILIIAGSSGMAGAAILCCRAALRTGAGLIYLSVPKEIKGTINCAVPEVIVLEKLSLKLIKDMKIDVIAIGPGLGLQKKKAVKDIINANLPLPVVLDADALNSIAGNPKILKKRRYPTIITPHPGEMARLLGTTVVKIQKDRIAIAKKFAKEYGVVTVLKGSGTVIADPSGKYFINPTGNPGMASGGVGDVLTGVIAALIGQKVTPFEAAVCAAFIHGGAADVVSSIQGQRGIIASDIIDMLPFMIKEVTG